MFVSLPTAAIKSDVSNIVIHRLIVEGRKDKLSTSRDSATGDIGVTSIATGAARLAMDNIETSTETRGSEQMVDTSKTDYVMRRIEIRDTGSNGSTGIAISLGNSFIVLVIKWWSVTVKTTLKARRGHVTNVGM